MKCDSHTFPAISKSAVIQIDPLELDKTHPNAVIQDICTKFVASVAHNFCAKSPPMLPCFWNLPLLATV